MLTLSAFPVSSRLSPAYSESKKASAPRAPKVAAEGPASVFLPKEHGSWSLVLEPVTLALLIVPSLAGAALAGVVLAAFFARRPFKAAFDPRYSERRVVARETVAMFMALMLAGAFEVAVIGPVTALWPLLLTVPFAALFAYFDGQGEGRAAAAELSGSAAFALLPATFALLQGASSEAALWLAAVALARSVPAILTVRTYLRLRKGQGGSALVAIAVAGVALAVLGVGATWRMLPWVAVAGAAVFFVRTVWMTTKLRPNWSARRIGMIEAVLGLVYVVGVALAYRLG